MDCYGFLLVFCSNFVPKTNCLRYSTCKYTVTLKPGLGSLNVTGTDTERSAAYDFLLTFHSNHGPILYRFREIRRFQSKIAKKNFHPLVFCVPAEGVLGIWYRRWGSKTRVMELLGRERSLTISLAVWIQSTNVTDRQTDTGRQQRPRIASCGKNARPTKIKYTVHNRSNINFTSTK